MDQPKERFFKMDTEKNMKWYIDTIKEKHGIGSNNKLADQMEFSRAAMSQFYRGENYPSETNMLEFARMAGVSNAVAIMHLRSMKSTGKIKDIYMEITSQLTKAIMVICAVSIGFMVSTDPALADNLSTTKSDSIYYVK